jgi:hypothetical protein
MAASRTKRSNAGANGAVTLKLSEADFEKYIGADVRAVSRGARVMGARESSVMEALPKVIRERLQKMTPPDFELKEIEMKLELSGKVFGVGVSGDVTAKFGRPD